ncbi:MAG: ABC transporter permease [Venatoribacter sp.]
MTNLLLIKPVLLWSDVLIFALLFAVLAFFYQLRKSPLTLERWRSVFQSATGLASLVVILFYIAIAVLDSLHYQEPLPQVEGQETVHYNQNIKSALDYLTGNLGDKTEKTYSEPFSLYSFAKENKQTDSGEVYRDFPRLTQKGLDRLAEQDKASLIWAQSLRALWQAGLLCLVLIGAHQLSRKLRNKSASRTPWWAAYLTFSLLVIGSHWALTLSEHFYIAGTNIVGQDVFYQSIKAVRTGVLIGTLATLLTMPLAIVLGISAGYFRGWVDDLVQYIYTTLSSIPGILLIAASVLLIDVYIETHPERFELGAVRADFKFLALCFILGMTSWTGLCRLLRAETLKLSQLDYVQAAHAFGVSNARIIFKHILPNTMHIILIALVLDFSVFVLAEAVLSYIGVGVDPSMASWGNMINEARSELSREPVVWWTVLSAFALMFALVLAANLFSDRVRDAFDPRG